MLANAKVLFPLEGDPITPRRIGTEILPAPCSYGIVDPHRSFAHRQAIPAQPNSWGH